MRTFTPALRVRTRESIERIVHGVCGALGATADFRWIEAYAAVVNDPGIAALVAREAAAVVGDEGVVEIPPIMGGDDFSAYLACAPGAYVLVGSRSAEAGSDFPHHHPRFTVDERALPIGTAVLIRSILALQAGER